MSAPAAASPAADAHPEPTAIAPSDQHAAPVVASDHSSGLFAMQAAWLLQQPADSSLHAELCRRAAQLRACEAAVTRQLDPLLPAALHVLRRLHIDFDTCGCASVAWDACAGPGLVARRGLPAPPRGTAVALPVRGVLWPTNPAARDPESRMETFTAWRRSSLSTSYIGPAAMANAACSSCANVRFGGVGHIDGVAVVALHQLRAVPAGAALCAA